MTPRLTIRELMRARGLAEQIAKKIDEHNLQYRSDGTGLKIRSADEIQGEMEKALANARALVTSLEVLTGEG